MKSSVLTHHTNSFGFMVLVNQYFFAKYIQCEFIEGFPDDLLSRLESTHDQGSLCVFDDVMDEVSSNTEVSELFTYGRSHLGCSLILMLQNIFSKWKA